MLILVKDTTRIRDPESKNHLDVNMVDSLRSRHSQAIRQVLNEQKREKEVMLKEFQEGPNAADKIEARLSLYRKLTLKLCLQGIQKGEQNSADFVYMFVSLWFKNIQEYENGIMIMDKKGD